jgi:hypothetical protein
MRTATIIVMATLTLAFSPLVGGEKRASGPEQETHRSLPATGGWPEQWGERKLHRGELALVYARKKAAADEAARMLRTVVEDVRQDGVTRPAVGLIVVIDAQEEFPVEIAKLTEVLGDPNSPATGARSKEVQSALKEARKLSDHAGADMNSLAAVLPIPLRPMALPKLAKDFPEGIDREIAWCLIVPTDAYLGAAWTAMRDAIINDPGVSWKDRWAVRTVFLLTARAARAELRKARQAGLYELLVEGQASLSSEQKKEKIKAYRQKLGLDHDSKSQADQEEKKERPEGGPSSA